jgi:hypothetical protein
VSAAARAAFARATRKSSPRDDASRGADDANPRPGGSLHRHTAAPSGAGTLRSREGDEAPIVLNPAEPQSGRLHRLNLFSAEIDRPNVVGTVGVSVAWRKETMPGRSMPTLGSLTTIRLAVNVNLKTRTRKIRQARSFFFALGREVGKNKVPEFPEFDDVDVEIDAPVDAAEIARSEPAAATQRPAAVAREPETASPPTTPDRQPVEEPRAEPLPRVSTSNGTAASQPAARPATPAVTRRANELDDLLVAMEQTQRGVAQQPGQQQRPRSQPLDSRPESTVERNVVAREQPRPTASAAAAPAALWPGDDERLHPLLQRRPAEPVRAATAAAVPPRADPAPTPRPVTVQQPAERQVEVAAATDPVTVAPPGWYPDPTGRAELRYWDGRWTAHVKTNGRLSFSPLAGPGSR